MAHGSVIQEAMNEQVASKRSRSRSRSRSSPEGISGCLTADILSYCFSCFLHGLLGSRRKQRVWEREESKLESFKYRAVPGRQDSVSSFYVIDNPTQIWNSKKKVIKVNRKLKNVKRRAYVKRK